MQIPKLQVLIEAGAVRDIEVNPNDTATGWTVRITYASRAGERCEVLERQRGGARVFATLDAVARCLAGLGLPAFRVDASGLTGAGDEPPCSTSASTRPRASFWNWRAACWNRAC